MPTLPRLPARLFVIAPALALAMAGCGDRYSPDTYATRAVQQANRVEPGVLIGVRRVQISAEGSTGAATGAAAGGVLGAQTPGGGIGSALGAVGGALVGGLVGRAAESAAVDTPAYEYVVRTPRDELLSVTQADRVPLAIGQRVLVITGTQARVVPDYTVAVPAPRPAGSSGSAPPADSGATAAPASRPTNSPAPADTAAAPDVGAPQIPPIPAPPVLVPPPPSPVQALPPVARPVAGALIGG